MIEADHYLFTSAEGHMKKAHATLTVVRASEVAVAEPLLPKNLAMA